LISAIASGGLARISAGRPTDTASTRSIASIREIMLAVSGLGAVADLSGLWGAGVGARAGAGEAGALLIRASPRARSAFIPSRYRPIDLSYE
jgi:hypothetical protein